MTKIHRGQLRRWVHPDHPKDVGKIFMILNEEWDRSTTEPSWEFLIDGRKDWHFEDVLERDSEAVSDAEETDQNSQD